MRSITSSSRSILSRRITAIWAFSLVLVFAGAVSAAAAPKAELWPRWTKHNELSSYAIDHEVWSKFLAKYVRTDADGVNVLGYGDISKRDRADLASYIVTLAMAPISDYSRGEQRAFWLNLYNALTVQLILDHFPVASIRDIDISPGWFATGPWGKKLIEVEGVALSLDDIEHRILRPIWKDPRIHYGVNCASIGCPNLQATAFTRENTDELLTAGARAYVNSPRGAQFVGDDLYVSSIYDWFMEDFGGSYDGVIRHLRRYAEPALEKKLLAARSVEGTRYDWSLNIDKKPE